MIAVLLLLWRHYGMGTKREFNPDAEFDVMDFYPNLWAWAIYNIPKGQTEDFVNFSIMYNITKGPEINMVWLRGHYYYSTSVRRRYKKDQAFTDAEHVSGEDFSWNLCDPHSLDSIRAFEEAHDLRTVALRVDPKPKKKCVKGVRKKRDYKQEDARKWAIK